MNNGKKNIVDLFVHLVSLGCPKNLVDSESMADILIKDGMQTTPDPELADIIIVNTCGFIESAKKEAIDKILEMADYKKTQENPNNKCDFLIVTGCLGQRYHNEITSEIPEADAVLGTAAYIELPEIIKSLYKDKKGTALVSVNQKNTIAHLSPERTPSTKGYAYLKVAEGCSNRCSYCAIPGIRGDYISRPEEEILSEAEKLCNKGVYEILLIAQDTTAYGEDIYGEKRLPELIKKMSEINSLRKIRLLYCYADGITDELIAEIRDNEKVAKYIEMPIQHADDNVLKRMNRRDTSKSIRDVVQKLRKSIPEITIRTTVLVGFPGETDEEFQNLKNFIEEMEFDLLGCFVFSPEEGTPSYNMEPKVLETVAEKRHSDIMISQKEISLKLNLKKIEKKYIVVIEGVDRDGIFYLARGDGQAPEIDPYVYVIAENSELRPGDTCEIEIADANEYELIGVAKK